MQMIDALREAVNLLSQVGDPNAWQGMTGWESRRAALLSADVDEAPAPSEEPLTDERWHQYAIAAIRGYGSTLAPDMRVTAHCAARFATEVADRMLEAANRQARTGKGAV